MRRHHPRNGLGVQQIIAPKRDIEESVEPALLAHPVVVVDLCPRSVSRGRGTGRRPSQWA